MSLIKQWLHDQMEQAYEDEMFFNADKHHEIQQAMMEEMEPPADIDPDYENFISNHPDGKYTPSN